MKYEELYMNDDYHFINLKPNYTTLHIVAENVVIKDKTLGFEIDLSKYLNEIEKINISGITFVKETK